MASTNVGSIHYDLGLDTTKFHSATAGVTDGIQKMAKVAAVAFAAIGAAAVAFGVSSAKSYMQAEDAIAGLEAGLKNTGEQVALVSKKLQDQAKNLQKVTKFSDEEILSADAMLTTFQLQGKTIEGLTPSLLDMAEGLRDADGNTISLSDAAKMMGKVMGNAEGGIEGMSTALKRNGVIMTDAQAEVFKTGTETERLNTLTEILSYNFGGRALAAGKTFGGQFTIMKNQIDEVKESIGLAILNGISPLMSKFKEFVNSDQFQAWLVKLTDWLSANLPIAVKYVTDTLLPALKKIFDDIWPVIQTVLVWMGDLITFLSNNTWVFWGVVDAFVAIKTAMFLTGAATAFNTAVTAIGGSSTVLLASLAPVLVMALAIGAALVTIGLVYDAAQKATVAVEGALEAQSNLQKQNASISPSMLQIVKDGVDAGHTKAQVDSAAHALSIGSRGIYDDFLKSKGYFFADGTNFAPGGMAIVGERGPEIVNLPRGSQVVPNDKLGGSLGMTSIYGDVNIGSKSDADYFFTRLNRSSDLMGMGLAG